MLLIPALALAMQSASVEVPFKMANNAIIVDAKINSHPVSLMFDTGFSGTAVTDSNVDLGPADGTMVMRDFVGEYTTRTVKIKSFEVGGVPLPLNDPEAVQQPLGHMTQVYSWHTDGIMGSAPIQGKVVEINFQNQKFIIHPDSFDASQRTPDNKKTFLLRMLPLGQNVMLPVKTSTGERMLFALDTGNEFFGTTHVDVLERVGLWSPSQQPKFMGQSEVGSGPVNSWEKKMNNLTIFGVPVPVSYWSVIDAPSSDAQQDGTVGIQFLKNFNIILDYVHRYVWLENFTGAVGNDPPGEVGIAATGSHRESAVVVLQVTPESPAEKAGIQVGDKLLEIDGQELSPNLNLRQVDSHLRGEVGSKVDIAVSHDGALTHYNLERAALVND